MPTVINNGCCYSVIKSIKNGVEYCFSSGGSSVKGITYLVVGGGGGGGSACGNTNYHWNGGGGGGGGEVLINNNGAVILCDNYCVIVGEGGTGSTVSWDTLNPGTDGGSSCIVGLVEARGGKLGCSAGSNPDLGGDSGNGFKGASSTCGGGGGGSYGDASGNTGGLGYNGYGGGGGGAWGYGCCGGGHGGLCNQCNTGQRGFDATGCGGGGGGGANGYYSERYSYGGNGAGGLVEICYPSDGRYGINSATGGNVCCTITEGGVEYCVHRFTSNGTFTIVS